MKTIKILKLNSLVLIILIVTQSCVVSSLNPLYTNTDQIHLDELNGVWEGDEKDQYIIRTIVDSSDYKLKGNLDMRSSFGSDEIDHDKIKKTIKDLEDKLDMKVEFPKMNKHYEITMITEKDTSVFDGNLSNLQGHYFLDLIPNDNFVEEKISKSFISGMMIRTHGFFKLVLKDDELIVNTIENDDFEDLIENKRVRIEHVERDNKVIITAKTEDIQKFLIKFADTEIFNDPNEALILKRIK
ncbi:hypothetical protein DWB61_02450 [Ancylomarina euxinus]|uniref:Lipoprotein n=1 Tax=Ancylomarina euxinus TaxID=2283627 RepID=A0A425Y665_9BACT|nr:hypothetical protein [Ancylomarina euxinus]MCZ4694136.1 hypothetical protein [Ancylomarina euxinus]MUP15802.1 hypothetical protein [Ancylomarina euxinus]RRG23994.1 hypothetical protein DWB61_02450 [Ancylomarina euxinus]